MRGGIDLGGTKIEAVVVDDEDRVAGKARRPTPRDGGPPAVIRSLAEALREAAASAGVDLARLEGAGLGSPGAIDAGAGTVAHAGNLPDWEEAVPVVAALGEELGIPVALGNDVGVAVDAETAFGAGRPYRSFLGLWWGTGIGGAVVLDRKRWLGGGSAGEIGHVVVKLGGARCPCGRRGCLEAYAGRAAMEAKARHAHKRGEHTRLFELMEARGRERLTSGVWAAALEHDDRLARKLVNRAVEALGAAIASVANVLDLEAIVLAGGLGTRLGTPYAERIAKAMLPHLFFDDRPPPVLVAELGDLAGAVGATLLLDEREAAGS